MNNKKKEHMKNIYLLLFVGLLAYSNPVQAAEMQVLGAASSAQELVQELPALLKEYSGCTGCEGIDKEFIINRYAKYRQQQSPIAAMTSLKRYLREKISAKKGRGEPVERDAKGDIITPESTQAQKTEMEEVKETREIKKTMHTEESHDNECDEDCDKPAMTGGRTVGRAEFQDFDITKEGRNPQVGEAIEIKTKIDRATPDLNMHCVSGKCDVKDDDCNGAMCDNAKEDHNSSRSNKAAGIMNTMTNGPCSDPENPGLGCDELGAVLPYLKIDGIDGESTNEKNNDWIEILSFAKAAAKDIKIDGIDGESNAETAHDWIEVKSMKKNMAKPRITEENGDWIEIQSMKANADNTGKIKGIQKKSLFGIFEITLSVAADVNEDGTLHNVSKPWYSFLAW